MAEVALRTDSERVDKDRVKLRVEVPEDALGPAISAAYRRWANELKVPGFRKGKVPRAIIDQRVGPEVIREEALRDALPDLYRAAMRSEDLQAVAPPDIEVLEFDSGAPLVFEVTVDVRPEIELPDLARINIEAPPAEVTDDDVNEQLERLRDRFAELETASREARRGDHVLIDLKGYRHDQLVEGASAPDLLYEIGSRTGPPKLDEELEGNRPGAILKFTDTVPEGAPLAGEEISFTVLLKEVKTKKLPALDDDFAKTVGEFDTLDELKDDLRTRLAEVKTELVEEEIRRRTLGALVDAADLSPPDSLVEAEFTHRLEHFEEDLKRAGLSLGDYARQAQVTELEMRRDLREQAAKAVAAELLLEEIARTQEIRVEEDEIGKEVALAAVRAGKEPKEVAKQVVESGRVGAIAADIMRRKALDHVVEHVNVVGRPDDEAETGPEAKS